MKSFITSLSFALLCLLMRLENTSAFMGFSFGNLLFSLNLCQNPNSHCPIHCKGPLAPRNFCDNQCSSTTNRRLDTATFRYNVTACDGMSGSGYSGCMSGATADCDEMDYDMDASYVAADGSSYAGDTSESNGVPMASRMSYLPFMVAAVVATTFAALYVWKKKNKEQQLINEDLLNDDDSFHGSVARRVTQASVAPSLPPAMVEHTTTGYALA